MTAIGASLRPSTQGAVHPYSGSSEGRIAADTIRGIHTDLCFLSTGTWNLSRGVTTPTMDNMDVKVASLRASTSCFLLADSTKFATVSKFGLRRQSPERREGTPGPRRLATIPVICTIKPFPNIPVGQTVIMKPRHGHCAVYPTQCTRPSPRRVS
ncbi:hypothetical protein J7I84_01750 [Arthrobacter sp. ISL-85]|uniref:hypothetical protein n=1 Tax=Arthrobacter sp. ISL-85 TaxID=2819115 RepID=UPI001BE739EA|nr:hypothetical protein [Arthrobacter sp. ISL-85]